MLAIVPIRCMSAGIGSAASALRCITMPTDFCSRTARCAARIERARPRAIGRAKPGNSTMPRTGTMTSPSGGSGGEDSPAPLSRALSSLAAVSASDIVRLRLLQRDQEAAMRRRPFDGGVASGRQTHPPLEPALRQFEAVNDRRADFRRINADPGDDEFFPLDPGL